MNKFVGAISILAAAALAALNGCVVRGGFVYHSRPLVVERPAEVVVTEAPPPPQREIIVEAPGPNYVWVPGYWTWHGHWVWAGGSWVVRPHPRAAWETGHWARHGHHYRWIPGHWR